MRLITGHPLSLTGRTLKPRLDLACRFTRRPITIDRVPPPNRGTKALCNHINLHQRRHKSGYGSDKRQVLDNFKQSLRFQPATCSFRDLATDGLKRDGEQVVLHGYLGTRRIASKSLTFAELHDPSLRYTLQLVSNATTSSDGGNDFYRQLLNIPEHSPVTITGTLKARKAPKSGTSKDSESTVVFDVEVRLENIVLLNAFPEDVIMKHDTVFPPEQRHLQIRSERSIRNALKFRSQAAQVIRDELCSKQDFTEIETPLLFKSTPEGAREFLVPTRASGFAYALPQSPQQYKQILMGSGIPRYLQIAKCFRDEDLRADRQPEFTQVDLEMAFAAGEDVMNVMERVIKRLWTECLGVTDLPNVFPRMPYEDAMSRYGSDKPDLRFSAEIHRIDYMIPIDLVSKIGSLTEPIVEAMKLSVFEDVAETRRFINSFMDSTDALPFVNNPDGQPGFFIYNSRSPLQGLQPFGFEAAERMEDMFDLKDGDLIVIQARKDFPFSGGSTSLGQLRSVLHKAAVSSGLIEAPEGFNFTWITDFPLFSPSSDSESGQNGAAGLASTHHPFTAPKTPEDVDLLLTEPLLAKADHYDLVVNGVELGGGSRRIHDAQMQEFVMRDVLKMPETRMQDFAHLIEVLRTGCPPHAGMALGFDRLIAVMLGKESIRDVIAFPKSGRGEDVLVKAPSRMTDDQLKMYHLKLADRASGSR